MSRIRSNSNPVTSFTSPNALFGFDTAVLVPILVLFLSFLQSRLTADFACLATASCDGRSRHCFTMAEALAKENNESNTLSPNGEREGVRGDRLVFTVTRPKGGMLTLNPNLPPEVPTTFPFHLKFGSSSFS